MNEKEKPVKVNKKKKRLYTYEFNEKGFEISVYNNGLLIESTDYHAGPLFLDEEKIKLLCLHLDKRKTRKFEKWKTKKEV